MQAEIKTGVTTISELLAHSSAKFGERPALVCRSGLRDEIWNYTQLHNAAYNVARQLREAHRLNPGDRVLIHGFNGPQLVAAYLGCMLAGVIVVPLDIHSSAEFIARVAAIVEAAALLSASDAAQLPGIAHIRIAQPDLTPPSGTIAEFERNPEDIAEIIFTSGTTGQPKGVILTHRNILACVTALLDVLPHRAELRFLSLLPLSHMFEQSAGLFAPLLLGASIYYPDAHHSHAILRKLGNKRIHGVIAVPQLLELLLHSTIPAITPAAPLGLRQYWPAIARRLPFAYRRRIAALLFPGSAALPEFFISGGAPLPFKVEESLELLGVRVVQGYGATECAPVISVNRFDNRISGSVGWPVAGVDLRLSEDSEILVRGANVTQGYWRNPEATGAAFTADGYYRTADLGEIGPHGEIYVRGRSNNAIVLASGMNVFPEDIETLLAAQPGIAACLVLGLSDADGSAQVSAVLRLLDEEAPLNEQQNTAQAAVRSVNAALASHQRIMAIHLWHGDFPRTPLLKIQRWKVREKLLNEQRDTVTDAAAPPIQAATLEELLASVCRVPVQSITADTDLDLDLGLDSLSCVELTVAIERQLGLYIDDAELAGVRRVGELKALLKRSESAPPSMNFPAWPLTVAAAVGRAALQAALLFPVHRWLSRSFQVSGLEYLDHFRGPALFIANHSSHADTVAVLRALPAAIRSKLAIAAAADYFFRNPALAGPVALTVNAFPFNRSGSIRASLEYCGELMDHGWSILIYPEGTRSPDGALLEFKSGIGFLAAGLGVPIVPVAIRGGHRMLPKGAYCPRRADISVSFGAPICIAPDSDKQEVVQLLHAALARLLDGSSEITEQPSLEPSIKRP